MTVEFKDQPAGNRPAYPDWERETRPEHAKDRFVFSFPNLPTFSFEWPLFHPAYVQVKGKTPTEIFANAQKILDLRASPGKVSNQEFILLGDDGLAVLLHLVTAKGNVDEIHTLLPLFIPETDWARQTLDLYCDTLNIGPAVPGLSVGQLLLAGSEPVRVDPSPRSDEGPVVVTAIIDTEIGIGHERFRSGQFKTRVRHFWRQKRESFSGMSGLTIGREFTADDIDAMLGRSAGNEREFYRLLGSAAYGRNGFEYDQGARVALEPEVLKQLERDRENFFLSLDRNPTIAPEAIRLQEGDYILNLLRMNPPTELHKALSDGPPYLTTERPLGLRAGHGTWVADIAAGYPMESAPSDRPIVAVELPDYAVADTAGQRLEVFVLMGLRRILNWCDDWNSTPGKPGSGTRVPVVINISLGNTAGPKDGTGFLETEIARLVDARNADGYATRVVIAAGNTYRDRLTARFDLEEGKSETIDWRVQADDRSPSFLEIRVPKEGTVKVTIAPPDGVAQTIAPGKYYDLMMQGDLVGRIYQPPPEVSAKDRTIILALAPTQTAVRKGRRAPHGTWRIGFQNNGVSAQVRLDVQRDDSLSGWPPYGRQSWLDHEASRNRDRETGVMDQPEGASPVVRTHTLSAHATGSSPNVLVVGGAMALDGHSPADWKPTRYTASGPGYAWPVEEDNARPGPDLSAVSEDGPATPGLRAAGYMSGSTAVFSGTSGAAPQVTRALVDALAQNLTNPPDLPGDLQPPEPARLGKRILSPVTFPGRHPRRGSAKA